MQDIYFPSSLRFVVVCVQKGTQQVATPHSRLFFAGNNSLSCDLPNASRCFALGSMRELARKKTVGALRRSSAGARCDVDSIRPV